MRFFGLAAYLYLLTACLAAGAGATNYYVSPTGNDGYSGLSLAEAWRSIDRGNTLGLTHAGDTVNVLPGTYTRSTAVTISVSGATGSPIVYRRYGKGVVLVNYGGASCSGVSITGSHIVVQGMAFTNGQKNGVVVDGHYCAITECYFYNFDQAGIYLMGSNCRIVRNIVYAVGDHAIFSESTARGNLIYGNTLYDNDGNGFEGSSTCTARLFNNIIAKNDKGVNAEAAVICSYNNVWGNTGGNYIGGCSDSAGGISTQPLFVNASGGRFDLLRTAAEINAGLPLDYFYSQSAPEIGAKEKYNVYYVDPAGDDSASGRTAALAWRSIDNGDSLLLPGDTVKVLPGTYADSVVIAFDGLVDDRIVYIAESDGAKVQVSSTAVAVRLNADYIAWSGIDISGASNVDISIGGSRNLLENIGVSSSQAYGIKIDTSGNRNTIIRCTFDHNLTTDLYIIGDSTDVFNNTCYSTLNGLVAASESKYNQITNNVFLGATAAGYGVDGNATSDLTYSIIAGYSTSTHGISQGAGCLLEDPLLLDPAVGNFRLGFSSPAIDAGTNLGYPYNGAAPDMGAFETKILNSLTITPTIDSLCADTVQQFDVIAVDEDGYAASPGNLTWSHTFSDGAIDSAGLFTPQSVGTGRVRVVSDIGGIADSTASFAVVPGSLAALEVSPQPDTVSADSTVQFTAGGLDDNGNAVTDLGELTWSVTGGIGTINQTGLFSAGRIGRGLISVASDLGVTGHSDTIAVVAGAMAFIDVLPSENIVKQMSSYQYAAYGYDADSNFVADYTDSAAWTTTDATGSITSGGLYTSGWVLGDFFVQGTANGETDSGRVDVTLSNELHHIRIERYDGTPIDDTCLTTDNDSLRLYARGYTFANSLIGDVPATWSLVEGDSIGSVNPVSGAWCQLTLQRPGTGIIVATALSGKLDSTGTVTCLPGLPASVVISPPADTVSADDSLQFSCQSLDADGNEADPQILPTWMVLGGIGTIAAGGLFTPTAVGGGKVICSGAGLADTADPVVVTAGAVYRIAVQPDSAIISADSSLTFAAVGYDHNDNVCPAGDITWSVMDPLGTINPSGIFHPTAIGVTRVIAVSDLGPIDTSAYLQVTAGRLTQLTISPDTAALTIDDGLIFTATGVDYLGNPTSTGSLSWEVIGDIGDINSLGAFLATGVGTGRIAIRSAIYDVVDTNGLVTVSAGALQQLVVAPDEGTLQIGETLAFTAQGYDAAFNLTDVGNLTWSVNGGIGAIDSLGLFTAIAPGYGSVTARSDIDSITGSTGTITVEALLASSIPLGAVTAYPGQTGVPILMVGIANPFASDKHLTQVILRSDISGPGTPTELQSDVAGVSLYLDRDADSLLTDGDSLLAAGPLVADSIALDFLPLTVVAGGSVTLIAAFDVALYPRDGDTLDGYLRPATDIRTAEEATAVGSASVNSLGIAVIDGLVADQIPLSRTEGQVLNADDSLFHIMTVDLPRNGYRPDTLRSLRVVDFLGMSEENFDSLVLFADDGDGVWGGAAEEQRLAKLIFSGEEWLWSGMNVPLNDASTRFFVGANLIDYPTNGLAVGFGIPRNGIEMRSSNDGPLDADLPPVDTLVIQSNEKVTIWAVSIPTETLTPGQITGPLLSLQVKNAYYSTRALDSLRCVLTAIDPAGGATQAILDSQIDSLLLYKKKDADPTVIRSTDSLVATAIVQNGTAVFAAHGLSMAGNGGTTGLCLAAALNLATAKNGNRLALALNDSLSVIFAESTVVTGTFPVRNDSLFTIDAFPAEAIDLPAIPSLKLTYGMTAQEVMAFDLPRNGYAEDRLRSLEIANVGSLDDQEALASVKLWLDISGDGYSLDDVLVGQFVPYNSGWRLANLNIPLRQPRTRFVVTVTATNQQFDGGTLQFEIPQRGVLCWSGMTGPDDGPGRCPTTHFVFPPNRVTVISVPTGFTVVAPGDTGRPALSYALYNGYTGQSKTLTGFTLTNGSHGSSAPGYFDHELGQVSLYYDDNNNRVLDGDSLIAAGYFVDNRLRMSSFTIPLAAESLAYFFICADLPLDITDGDSLTMGISTVSDITFAESVNLNGDIPLSSRGALIVDGSVARQYQVPELVTRSLRPGESAALVLAFRPAFNGDRSDVLEGVTLTNAEDADTSDIASVRLWLDLNDDGIWQITDSLLADLIGNDKTWSASDIDLPIGTSSKTVLVLADIASTARPDAKLRFEIPVNGCQYRSGNDGPRDGAVGGENVFTISDYDLSVAAIALRSTYSVGQSIPVGILVSNLLSTPLDSVSGMVVETGDSSLVALDSLNAGPRNLAGGETGAFSFYYTGQQPGPTSWSLRAVAGATAESSAVVSTGTVTIQMAPSGGNVTLINSTPTAVTRGQKNVIPLTLLCRHLDTLALTAPLRLDSLRLRIEDATGAGIPADQAFSRITLAVGYNIRASYDAIPAESVLTLPLAEPMIVLPGQRYNLSLMVDIDSLAEASSFRLIVTDPAAVPLVDDNTGISVPMTATGGFPVQTPLCWIHDPAQQVMVSASSLVSPTVNFGQNDVDVLAVGVRHTGDPGSASVQVTSLMIAALDSLGEPVWPHDLFSSVAIARDQQVIGERTWFSPESTIVSILLGSPLNLNYGQSDTLRVMVTVKESSPRSGFRLGILDSTAFLVRDINTGNVVETVSDTAALQAGLVFPMMSDWTAFRQSAPAAQLCVTSLLPSAVVAGADSVAMVAFEFTHPGAPISSALQINGVSLAVTDTVGIAQDAALMFDHIGCRIDGGPVDYQDYVLSTGGLTRFAFTEAGLTLASGETVRVELVGDIDQEVPYDNFRLMIPDESRIEVYDYSDGRPTGQIPSVGCPFTFPVISSAARIFLAAGRPMFTSVPLPTALSFPGDTAVALFQAVLDYQGVSLQGEIAVQGLQGQVLRRTESGTVPVAAAEVFGALRLFLDGQVIAADTILAAEGIDLVTASDVRLLQGSVRTMTLAADIRASAPEGNYCVQFADSTFLEMMDGNLLTPLYPLATALLYPLTGAEVAVAAVGLEESFTNYPNPFFPSRGQITTIGYVLPEEARVDIAIFSITGELVKTIAAQAIRAGGSHQVDCWNGLNDGGREVVSGTYFCRITAHYASGKTESFKRKVAVIR